MKNISCIFFLICFLPSLIFAGEAINLNTAELEELISLLKIDEKKAQAIIDYRQKNNGFKSINELEKIFNRKFLRKLERVNKIYAVSENVWKTRLTEKLDDLKPEILIIKTFPLNGYAAHIAFPDGGNMLIDTGSKKDSDELISILKKERISKREAKLMTVVGWKPKIDWLVITNLQEERAGGFEGILKNFIVRQVITSLSAEDIERGGDFRNIMDSFVAEDSIHINLVDDEEIDVKQTVSPVKLFVIGSKCRDRESGLCLKLLYKDFSFLFLSDLSKEAQVKMARDYEDLIKSTFLFYNKLKKVLKKKIKARFFIRSGEENTFITDGHLIFRLGGVGKVSFAGFDEINRDREIAVRYEYALELFKINKYSMAIEECETILEIEPNHRNSIKLVKKAKKQIKKLSKKLLKEIKTEEQTDNKELSRIKEELKKVKGDLREKVTREEKIKNHWTLGIESYNESEYEKAIIEFRKVLDLDPAQYHAHILMKKALHERNMQGSEKYFNEGLKAYNEGNLEEAIGKWQKALELDPESREIQTFLENAERELRLQEEIK